MAVLVPGPVAARPGDDRVVESVAGPSARRGRTRPVGLVLAVGLLATLVAALLVGGGAPQPSAAGLPSAGPATGWGLPVVTLLLRLASVATVGVLVLAALLVPRDLPGGDDLVGRAVASARPVAGVWLLAETARVLLLTSSLLAVPLTQVPPAAVGGVLTGLAPGRAALLSAGALALLLLGTGGRARAVLHRAPRRQAGVLLLLALVALLSPVVLAGHSAGAGDHALAVGSLAVHVVTAAAWVGGLGALVGLGRGLPAVAPVVRRLSTLALGCVVLLGVTGLVSASVLTGASTPAAAAQVLGSGYGVLLLGKTAALVALAAAGAWHRRRTVAALESGRPRAFRRLAAAELVVMAATVVVAVALAASPPPAATASTGAAVTAAEGPAAPGPAADEAAPDGAAPDEAAPDEAVDPMAGHDHGELSVGVLVDDTRFHVAGPVRPGQPVTVYNSATTDVTITAADGSFDVAVPGRTFMTFPAPAAPGSYPFASRTDPAFADALVVAAD